MGFWDRLKKQEQWSWKFRKLNDSDYELDMKFTVKDNFFMKVYGQAVHHFARSHGKTAKGDPKLIDSFDIDQAYLSKTKLYVSKAFGITANDIYRQNGGYLVSYDVSNVHFKRDGEGWLMTVSVKGVFNLK